MGSKEITDSAKGNGSRLPSPNHQSEEEKTKQMRAEVCIYIPSILESDTPSSSQNCKIFKGHHEKKDEKFYKPSVISIGPYHHGGEHLKTMEESKMHFFKELLKRPGKTSEAERSDELLAAYPYVEKMKSLEVIARDCYPGLSKNCKNDRRFSKMMLLDGCFIVELIHRLRDKRLGATLSKGGRLTSILHDLALVENQLPFFVLWELLGISVANVEERYEYIQQLVSTFKKKMPGVKTFDKEFGPVTNVKHLVDLLHSLWSPPDHNDKVDEKQKRISSIEKDVDHGKLTNVKRSPSDHKGNNEDEEEKWISLIREGEHVKWTHINSTSELIEAGIHFKKTGKESLFDITFTNGKFKIPSMIIEDRTESLYHNIIAYEQHSMLIEESGDEKRYSKRARLTFYCRLMDCLINGEKDVQILRKRGIIVNCLGDDKAVADMFNRLGVHVGHFSNGFFYAPLFNDVNDYYNKQWNKWRTTLWREHLKNPWKFISVAAAVLLLVLTALQTQFAAFPLHSKGG